MGFRFIIGPGGPSRRRWKTKQTTGQPEWLARELGIAERDIGDSVAHLADTPVVMHMSLASRLWLGSWDQHGEESKTRNNFIHNH